MYVYILSCLSDQEKGKRQRFLSIYPTILPIPAQSAYSQRTTLILISSHPDSDSMLQTAKRLETAKNSKKAMIETVVENRAEFEFPTRLANEI